MSPNEIEAGRKASPGCSNFSIRPLTEEQLSACSKTYGNGQSSEQRSETETSTVVDDDIEVPVEGPDQHATSALRTPGVPAHVLAHVIAARYEPETPGEQVIQLGGGLVAKISIEYDLD